jgi:hypothetical protein
MKCLICLKFCYKCRNYKKLHPELEVIEIKNSVRGLGDLVSIITYHLHIPHCSGCERRRQILNKLFPLKWLIPRRFRYPADKRDIRKMLKEAKVKKFPVIWEKNTKSFLPAD